MGNYILAYEFAKRMKMLYENSNKNYSWFEYRVAELEARLWPNSQDGHGVYSS